MKFLIINNIFLFTMYALEVIENTKLKKLIKEFLEH
jgi:hypothetical protein